eukprot:m.305316 g.305316  ORF g.305316 m.305316 type:complete len:745 (-) comp17713_c0_seq1:531-2765(-)
MEGQHLLFVLVALALWQSPGLAFPTDLYERTGLCQAPAGAMFLNTSVVALFAADDDRCAIVAPDVFEPGQEYRLVVTADEPKDQLVSASQGTLAAGGEWLSDDCTSRFTTDSTRSQVYSWTAPAAPRGPVEITVTCLCSTCSEREAVQASVTIGSPCETPAAIANGTVVCLARDHTCEIRCDAGYSPSAGSQVSCNATGALSGNAECLDHDACNIGSCNEHSACLDESPPSMDFACGPCTGGYFGDGYNCTVCSTCPLGHALSQSCNATHDAQCHQCPDGTQPRPVLNDVCEPCPPGRAGVGGQCALCPTGTVPLANRTECRPCAATERVSDSGDMCETCSTGTVPSVDGRSCVACTAAEIAVEGECVQCNDGFMPARNRSTCESCPSGFAGTQGICSLCLRSQPNADSTACVPCQSGEISLEGTCSQCPPGTTPSSALNFCQDCPDTHYGINGSCTLCPKGSVPNSDRSKCEPCPTGTIGIAPGQCSLCPTGSQPNSLGTACSQDISVSLYFDADYQLELPSRLRQLSFTSALRTALHGVGIDLNTIKNITLSPGSIRATFTTAPHIAYTMVAAAVRGEIVVPWRGNQLVAQSVAIKSDPAAEGGTSSSSSTFPVAIIGAVCGVVGLLILIEIIVLVRRRGKTKFNTSTSFSKSPRPRPTTTNKAKQAAYLTELDEEARRSQERQEERHDPRNEHVIAFESEDDIQPSPFQTFWRQESAKEMNEPSIMVDHFDIERLPRSSFA